MDDAAQSQATNPADDLTQLTKDPVPTLTEEIEQVEQDYQQMYNQGGHFKEQLESIANKLGSLERSAPHEQPVNQVEVVQTTPEIEKSSELAGFMEIVEKEAELNQSVYDDYTNKVLLAPSNPQNPVINLPLTADEVHQGLHHKVWEAISWLATWCLRQVKMNPDKVKYKP
jgi:hypothetical protein